MVEKLNSFVDTMDRAYFVQNSQNNASGDRQSFYMFALNMLMELRVVPLELTSRLSCERNAAMRIHPVSVLRREMEDHVVGRTAHDDPRFAFPIQPGSQYTAQASSVSLSFPCWVHTGVSG